MGNRGVICFAGEKCGIYLHWNGGRDSVEAFLTYCEMRGFRPDSYGIARMAQVIGNFFGGGLSVGIINTAHRPSALDNGDNGVYYVKNWKIVRRYPKDVSEQRVYDLHEMLAEIDAKQPETERIGPEIAALVKVKSADLKIGDRVLQTFYDKCAICTVVGRAADWRNRGEVPYMDMYVGGAKNGNNFITEETCWAVRKEDDNAGTEAG